MLHFEGHKITKFHRSQILMKKTITYIFLASLLLLTTAFLTEFALGLIYDYRNRGIEPIAAKDYPFLYFLYEKSPERDIHGFKTNHPIAKPSGKFRIILTGGSVAMGNAPKESIAHYLEQELNERFVTNRIEVINAGVSAFVAEQVFLNIQLILQHYEPNIIVSLDGYNDLMTFRLNRQYPSEFELPPHYWQDFMVIKYNSEKASFRSRFSYLFKNISYAIRYFNRKEFEKNYDWSSLNEDSLRPYSTRYWQILDDTYDFCKAKKISYYNFLQPVRSYDRNAAQDDADMRAMSLLYRQFESGTKAKTYAYSVTSIFNGRQDMFTDDCHVIAEGNKMFSKAISERISDELEAVFEN